VTKILNIGVMRDHSSKQKSVISGFIAAALWGKNIATLFRQTCLPISRIILTNTTYLWFSFSFVCFPLKWKF